MYVCKPFHNIPIRNQEGVGAQVCWDFTFPETCMRPSARVFNSDYIERREEHRGIYRVQGLDDARKRGTFQGPSWSSMSVCWRIGCR